MKNAHNRLTKKLRKISNESSLSIRKIVAQEALDHSYDDPKNFFCDLLSHGCASGMIGSLIYYRDTHKFFDLHYSEIEELRYEYEDNLGEPLQIKGDLKNFFAWFAFEETAYRLAHELELEV